MPRPSPKKWIPMDICRCGGREYERWTERGNKVVIQIRCFKCKKRAKRTIKLR